MKVRLRCLWGVRGTFGVVGRSGGVGKKRSRKVRQGGSTRIIILASGKRALVTENGGSQAATATLRPEDCCGSCLGPHQIALVGLMASHRQPNNGLAH